MYKILILCFNASLLFLLVCCSSPEMRKLEQLEQYADVNPSGVLAVLDSMDISDGSRAEQALYALLYSQAQYKCYIAAQSDSLIRIASDYYEDSKEVRRRMLAHYYLACVQYEIGNYGQSIISASKAEKDAIEIGDNYYLGLIYTVISDSYDDTYNSKEELRYTRLSRKAYERAGKRRHELFAILNEGQALIGMRSCDLAATLLDSLMRLPDVATDTILLEKCMRFYASALFLDNKYDEAKRAYLSLLNFPNNQPTVDDLASLSSIYSKLHNEDSALYYIKMAHPMVTNFRDSVQINSALGDFEIERGNYKQALTYDRQITHLQSKAITFVMHEELAAQHKEYYRNESSVTAERAEADKRLFSVCFVALVIVFVLAFLFYREKNHRKLDELNHIIESVKEVNTQLMQQKEDLNIVQQRIKQLYGDQFEVLDQLINTYLDHEGSNRNATAVLRELESSISTFSSTKKVRDLQQIVDENFNNITLRLQSQIPGITDAEVRLFLYLGSHFSSRTIALFMGDKLENIYNKKSRLKKKIINSEAVDKTEFLEFFV